MRNACFAGTARSAGGYLRSGYACVLMLGVVGLLAPVSAANRVKRTPEEVGALIEKVGGTEPAWWNSTPLTYPETLDLDWPLKAPGGWDNRVNVGQYIWDVINPGIDGEKSPDLAWLGTGSLFDKGIHFRDGNEVLPELRGES